MKKEANKKNKKFLKICILIILLIALVFLTFVIYEKIQEYRFQKMLQDNDANNYELTEIVNRRRNQSLCER